MNTSLAGVPQDTARLSHVKQLLSRYPGLSSEEIDDLKVWFKSEASAFDVATLAGAETLEVPYRAFRADHIDPLGMKEYVIVAFAVVVMAAGIWYLF